MIPNLAPPAALSQSERDLIKGDYQMHKILSDRSKLIPFSESIDSSSNCYRGIIQIT